MGKFISIAPENKAQGIHIIHSPHLLGSLQLLGASPARLAEVYASESKILPPPPSPETTITRDNWREYLGDRNFTQAYLAFFTQELNTTHHGDWRALLTEYLLTGPNPLIHSMTGDLCHPIIHLGYAYELGNADLATGALVYSAVHYDPATEAYLNIRSSSPDSNTPPAASSPLEVLARVRADKRLAGFPPEGPGREHFAPLFEQHESVVLEHWRSWPSADDEEISAEKLCEALDACVSLLMGTTREGGDNSYDFILLHALTGCYALRVVLPVLPVQYHAALFNQWWLFTLMVYITQGRPEIDDTLFTEYPLEGKNWSTPVTLAIESPAGFDAHYVKAIRAFKSAAEFSAQVGGSARHSQKWYLKAATKFAETFRLYKGFGPVDEDMIQQLMALTGQGTGERH